MAAPPSRAAAESQTEVEVAQPAAEPSDSKPTVALEEHLPAAPLATADVPPPFTGVRSAVAVRRDGLLVTVRLRDGREIVATLDAGVEDALIDDAIAARDRVLVEAEPPSAGPHPGRPVLIGVVATRRTQASHIEGERLVIEGRDEIVLRSGRAALRLRSDGDVELVGSRISASSRGLFRLVGRLLRLN